MISFIMCLTSSLAFSHSIQRDIKKGQSKQHCYSPAAHTPTTLGVHARNCQLTPAAEQAAQLDAWRVAVPVAPGGPGGVRLAQQPQRMLVACLPRLRAARGRGCGKQSSALCGLQASGKGGRAWGLWPTGDKGGAALGARPRSTQWQDKQEEGSTPSFGCSHLVCNVLSRAERQPSPRTLTACSWPAAAAAAASWDR